MTIDPFISFAVWFVGAVIITVGGWRATENRTDELLELEEHDQLMKLVRVEVALIAVIWPVALILAMLFSPVLFGIAMAKLIQHLSRKGKP